MNVEIRNRKIVCALALAALVACCLVLPVVRGGTALAYADSSGTVRVLGAKSAWRAYRLVAGEVAEGRVRNCSTAGLMNDEFWKRAGIDGANQDAAEKLAAIAAGDSNGAATARLGRAALSTHAPAVEVSASEAKAGISLASGYWLLVSDSSQPLLLPVGPQGCEATAKSSGPTLKKQVKDASGRWREASEAGQGQKVSYRIVATMPSNAAAFEALPYKVVDELPGGMWADAESVRVAVRDVSGNERDATASCAVSCADGKIVVDVGKGNALAVLPAEPGKASVIVRYEAKLTEKSAVGAKDGNPNLAHVECPGSPTSDKTVSTEKSVAQLYTWKICLVKSGSGSSLPGASFELRTAQGGTVGRAVTGEDGTASFPTIASGTYLLVETEAPKGFARAGDTTVTVRADLGTRGAKTRISAHAEGAGSLKSVSVPRGTVTVSVVDPAASEDPSEGRDSDSEGLDESASGLNPKTGDPTTWALLAAGVLAVAAGAFVACRAARRAGNQETIGEEKGR